MGFGLYWISIGILFIIIEVFLLTLDFLAIGTAAIITGIFIYIFNIGIDQWWISGIIFIISSIISLYIMKKYLINYFKKGVKGESPLSIDNAKGQHLKIQISNGEKVVFYDGGFWNIETDDEVKQGDTVEIIEINGGKIKVKKIM